MEIDKHWQRRLFAICSELFSADLKMFSADPVISLGGKKEDEPKSELSFVPSDSESNCKGTKYESCFMMVELK